MQGKIIIYGLLFAVLAPGCHQESHNDTQAGKADQSVKPEVGAMIGYDEFLVRAGKVSTGAGKDVVKALLGEPDSESGSSWRYDLTGRDGFPGIPPSAGTTVFVDVKIEFEEGRVKNISRNWMDATGSGS